MKKYLFGILAIALAIGFSAFTSHKTGFTRDGIYTFSTSVNNTIATLDMGDVAEPSNWTFTTTPQSDFNNGSKLAAISFAEEVDLNVDAHISLEQALEDLVGDYSGSAFSSLAFQSSTGDATSTTINVYRAQ